MSCSRRGMGGPLTHPHTLPALEQRCCASSSTNKTRAMRRPVRRLPRRRHRCMSRSTPLPDCSKQAKFARYMRDTIPQTTELDTQLASVAPATLTLPIGTRLRLGHEPATDIQPTPAAEQPRPRQHLFRRAPSIRRDSCLFARLGSSKRHGEPDVWFLALVSSRCGFLVRVP